MARRNYSSDFKDQVVQEVLENDNNTNLVAKKHGISQRTVYNWFDKHLNKGEYNQKKELKALKKELYEANLQNQILKDLLKKTYQVWETN